MGCCSSKPAVNANGAGDKYRVPEGSNKDKKNFNFKRNISTEWEIFHRETLGRGAFGVVKKCKRVNDPDGVICAVKIIAKSKLECDEDIEDLRVEVDCMKRLGTGSLNCITLYEAYEDDTRVFLVRRLPFRSYAIVMEMASGGELYDRIQQGNYTEALAAQVARSILQMVAQCHAKHIVYRDIKPNNFLFFTKDPDSPLKATDFGLAVYFPPGSPPLQDTTGTPFYMAPELIRQEYGFEADLWSAGALIYQLLSGHTPFSPNPNLNGRNVVVDLFQRILNAPIDYKSDPWPRISDQAKDLVQKLMTRDPKKRISVTDALLHPWLQEGNASAEPLDGDVVQRLQRYGTYGKFRQKAMVAALAKAKQSDGKLALPWSTGNSNKLDEMFKKMDVDKNGVLTYEEIREGLDAAGYCLADSEVKQLFMATDVNGTGDIDPNEFLAAMLDWQKQQESTVPELIADSMEENDNIWREIFDKYDADGNGSISVDEIAEIMGVEEDSPVILDVLREADSNTDGKISFQEFKTLMDGSGKDNLAIYSQRQRAPSQFNATA